MSKKLLNFEEKSKENSVVIIDTQGMASYDSTEEIDCKVFLLSFFFSDVLCFNNFGPIDEQTLNNFSLALEISKMFSKSIISSENK